MDENQIVTFANECSFSSDVLRRFHARYGKRIFSLVNSLKRPGKYQSIRVNTLKITPSNFLRKIKKLDEKIIQHPKINEILLIPVKGPFNIKKYNKIVIAKKQAAENVFIGTNLYAPGVNRASKIKPEDKVSIYDGMNNHVASGTAKMTAREMLESKHGLAIEVEESIFQVLKLRELEYFENGFFYSQSLPAAVTSRNLDPKKNEIIFDLCAAPGGKTTHLAQLLENKGKIIAIDRSKPRIKQLKRNLERLNIKNVEIFTNKDINYLRDEYKESIDKVLIDPPCSSIGVRPKLYDLTTEKEILDCARYQKNFLHLAHEFLKPDGIAIYSTCTLEPEENELNIKYAVENLAFEIIEQDYFLGLHGERTQGLDYLKLQRFYPNIHDYTGYFIAKLRKK